MKIMLQIFIMPTANISLLMPTGGTVIKAEVSGHLYGNGYITKLKCLVVIFLVLCRAVSFIYLKKAICFVARWRLLIILREVVEDAELMQEEKENYE